MESIHSGHATVARLDVSFVDHMDSRAMTGDRTAAPIDIASVEKSSNML